MAPRPNLLFVFTDQQRFDTMRCYGNDWIRTPHLNALAEQSFVFENAYVTQPVCTPSRSSIVTGLYPHTNGCTANNIPLGPDTPTIAEMISDDYARGYFGKWHLGDEIVAQHGFDHWVSIEDNYRKYYSREEYLARFSSYHHFLLGHAFQPNYDCEGARVFSRGFACKVQERFTKPAFLAQEATRFLEEHRERPFLLYVNFLEPHSPYLGPFYDLYSPDDLPTPPHFLEPPPENASRLHRLMADLYMNSPRAGFNLRTEADWRRLRSEYMGNVTLVDRAVGRMLEALDVNGLAENTIVVFTSDHGDLLGDHGILAKCVMYEEATRVPLLMRVPWLASQPRRIGGCVSQVDLVPTLLELLDQPLPDGLQGKSRCDVLRDEASLDDNDAFIEWNGPDGRRLIESAEMPAEEIDRIKSSPWRTIMTGDGWKLNLSPHDHCELYDLNTDPTEQRNLFDDPAQKERVRDLATRIHAWQERTNDKAPLPDV